MWSVLLLVVVLATARVGAADEPKVNVACETIGECKVALTLEDGIEHAAVLVREESNIFGEGAKLRTLSGKETLIAERELRGVRYHTKLGESVWGTALISHDGKQLIEGIFSTKDHGVYEWKMDEKMPGIHSRRRALVMESDEAWELPTGMPWKAQIAKRAGLRVSTPAASLLTAAESAGRIIPFFPSCYPQDTVTHVFKMGLILDWGLYQSLSSRFTGSETAKRDQVLADVEKNFAYVKLIFLSQLNIRLEIQEIIIGEPNDPVPLSGSISTGTCMGAQDTMQELLKWLNAYNAENPSGYWMLVSNCFSGINGVSYIGNMCGTTNNGGVAAYSWSVIAHELGHGFGMNHCSTKGGLMDYGDVTYQGVVQFNPIYNKPDVCTFLGFVKASGNCKFFYPAPSGTDCGDGVLDKTEECECLDRTRSCGKCINCKLVDSTTQCSSKTFVVREASSRDIVVVEQSALSSSECCIRNMYAPPKTLCGDGLLNACASGKCIPICTAYLEADNPNCGFDSTGCLLGCVWKNKCQFDMPYDKPSGGSGLMSALPDGASCIASSGTQGTCSATKCVPMSGEIGNNPEGTSIPTGRPTSRPSNLLPTVPPTLQPSSSPKKRRTTLPTAFPTHAITVSVTEAPVDDPGASIDYDLRCRRRGNSRKACLSMRSCSWCGRTCRQTGIKCKRG